MTRGFIVWNLGLHWLLDLQMNESKHLPLHQLLQQQVSSTIGPSSSCWECNIIKLSSRRPNSHAMHSPSPSSVSNTAPTNIPATAIWSVPRSASPSPSFSPSSATQHPFFSAAVPLRQARSKFPHPEDEMHCSSIQYCSQPQRCTAAKSATLFHSETRNDELLGLLHSFLT